MIAPAIRVLGQRLSLTAGIQRLGRENLIPFKNPRNLLRAFAVNAEVKDALDNRGGILIQNPFVLVIWVTAVAIGRFAQMLAAFIGTSFFAILFGLPRRFYVPAGIVGMIGWITFLGLSRYTPAGVFASTFIASTVVAFISRFAAIKLKCPSTLFLICGEFPMIPGGGVFWTAYYIASEQFPMALNSGLQSIKITIAIVLGIIIAANLISRRKAA